MMGIQAGWRKRISILLLAVMLVSQFAGSFAFAADSNGTQPAGTITVAEAVEDAASYLFAQSALSDWDAYALAKAGKPVPAAYKEAAAAQLQQAQGKLTLVTEYARMALGVMAAGADPRSIGGYDLIAGLYNNDRMTNQGNNGVIFSLLALNEYGRDDFPNDAKWTRQKLVDYLLQHQNADGGWSLGGDVSGADLTGAAIAALAPHRASAEVQRAVALAVDWLARSQLSNGGYNDGGENAETAAQAVIGLSAVGVDARQGAFAKADGNLISFLMKFRQQDGGFGHLEGLASSSMPTNQSLQALAAYHKLNPDGGIYPGSRRTEDGSGGQAKSFATIHVEGPEGTIAEGGVRAATVYEALDTLLTNAGIAKDITQDGWIHSIKGIAGQGFDTWWGYIVKRQGKWDFDQAGNNSIQTYKLQNGDDIYVYYTSMDTKFIDGIEIQPVQPQHNEPFQVKIDQTVWSNVYKSVAANVYVTAGGQKQQTNGSGIATFSGLPEGSYTLTVTGGVYNGAPAVLKTSQELTVGALPTVAVQVEGPDGPVTSGTGGVSNVFESVTKLLQQNGIPYEVVVYSFGSYIKSIGGYADNWSFAVWRNGAWIVPDVGMSDFKLKANDKVAVYFGGMDENYNPTTSLIQSVRTVPALPGAGEPFAVLVEKAVQEGYPAKLNIVPASGVQVKIGSLNSTTNEQGVAVFGVGLPAGTYTATVSGYVPGSAPKIVRTTGTIVAGSLSHVSIQVEGAKEPIAAGIASIATSASAFDALQSFLNAEHISYEVDHAFGSPYIKTIKDDTINWNYVVVRGGAIDFPQVGMSDYTLQPGDRMIVYYGELDSSWNPLTMPVNSVTVSPGAPLAGSGFTVQVSKAYYDYALSQNVVIPAAGVQVQVGSRQATTDAQGSATFPGMSAGAYPVTVSGYNAVTSPAVVRSVTLLTVVAPAGGGNGNGGSAGPIVSVSVEGDASRGTILSLQQVSYSSGDNPYTVLVRALGADRVESRGTGTSLYVSGIDGLREFDQGAMSGWVYAVNCTVPGSSAGSYSLRSGDRVDWRYSLNNGDDVKSSISTWCKRTTTNGGSSPGSVTGLPAVTQELLDGIGSLSIGYGNSQPADPNVRTVTVVNGGAGMNSEFAQQLRGELQANEVKLEQDVNASQATTLSDAKEEVKLQIQPNALKEDTKLSVRELGTMGRTEAVSPLYEFGPSGTKFDKPVYITIKTTLEFTADQLEKLALAWLNEQTGEWIPIPAVIDAATGEVTGAVDHFTKFAVIDKAKLGTAAAGPDLAKAIASAVSRVLSGTEWSDWEAYGLASAGAAVPAGYMTAVEQALRDSGGVFRNVTEYERMALGVMAAGGNPRSAAGVDLIAKIYNNERMTAQGVNGPIFALLVLNTASTSVPAEAKWNEAKLIDWLLQEQNSDGSWSLVKGEEANVDLTAMALVALAPFQGDAKVRAAIDKATAWLSQQQLASGGFKLSGVENSESASQVLLALAALHIPATDTRFVKTGGNVLTNVLSYQNADGGFAHVYGEASVGIATEQALLALAKYDRMARGGQTQQKPASDFGYADAAAISGWARVYVQKAKQYGLMDGVGGEQPRFAPQDALTRAQFVAIVLRLLGEQTTGAAADGLKFADIPAGSWYAGYVSKAVSRGIVQGVSADSFAPDRSISRQEMAIVLSRALGLKAAEGGALFSDLEQAYAEAVPAINAVAQQGYMEGADQGKFMPAAAVTREMAATVVVRIYEKTRK